MFMNMNRSNIFVYHITALVFGGVYFFGSLYGFNFIGSTMSPMFTDYQTDSIVIHMLMNAGIALLGSIVPAIVVMVLIHFTLRPNTKLFVFSLLLSFLMLSIWSIWENHYSNTTFLELSFLYSLLGKALGRLIVISVACVIYLHSKPNKSFKTAGQKNPCLDSAKSRAAL